MFRILGYPCVGFFLSLLAPPPPLAVKTTPHRAPRSCRVRTERRRRQSTRSATAAPSVAVWILYGRKRTAVRGTTNDEFYRGNIIRTHGLPATVGSQLALGSSYARADTAAAFGRHYRRCSPPPLRHRPPTGE